MNINEIENRDNNTEERDEQLQQAMDDISSDESSLVSADAILPQTLFILPVRSSPIYPGMMAPVVITRQKLIDTVENAMANRGLVGLVLTKNADDSDAVVDSGDLFEVGTAVKILRRLNSSDGSVTVLVQSVKRFRMRKIVRTEPSLVAQVDYVEDKLEKSIELDALVRSVISQVKKLSETNPFFTEEIRLAMANVPGPAALADLVAFALSLKREDAQEFLETASVKERFEKLLVYLKKEQEISDVQRRINDEVGQKISGMQKEFFLKEQMRMIRKELGGKDGDADKTVDNFREKIEATKFSEDAKKVALEELSKLEATSENSPEYNVIRNYLDWMLSLPWGIRTEDSIELTEAKKILDEDHFGIQKVKERILEFLAVRKLNPKAKGSILCLVGPPGVGKTSLGRSVARAMGRNFFRFSMGGMRDEAEIKGHRRTYIGAMPGKFLNALKRSGSQNPVIVLDEVDKLGTSFQGDPASALLEVLDPEQNQSFLDHYLDVPFDLSDVFFILTANTLSTIPGPLLDRMEVVELSGYTLEEKIDIAKRHVIPKEIEKSGIPSDILNITDEALEKLMHDYCREPGMRSLQQKVAAICRKVAAKIVVDPTLKSVKVTSKDLYDYLGPARFENEVPRRTQTPGVVTGLAWTPLGGQILFIEAGDVPKAVEASGTGGHLKITGQLGEVMNESASIAFSYVKKKVSKNRTAQKFFRNNDVHIHVPAGATPKDGPSAGVTMATALYSLATGSPVKPGIAMTGELSLVGKVLPVGGIKEKVLAAKRAGVKLIVIPEQNRKDLKEMTEANLKGMKFVFADTVDDVFKAVF